MITRNVMKIVKEYIQKYTSFDEQDARVAASYAMTTWMFHRFSEVRYLQIRGGIGTGNTVALNATGKVCFNPIFSYGFSSPGHVMSLVANANSLNGGTLCVDDTFEIVKKNDEFTDFGLLLDCGKAKNQSFIAKMVDGELEIFNTYGPKIFVFNNSLKDTPSIAAYCIMVRAQRRNFIYIDDLYKNMEADAEKVRGAIVEWAEQIGMKKQSRFSFADMVSMISGVNVVRRPR